MTRFRFISAGVLLLPALLLLGGCVADAPYKVTGDTQPQQLNDGWTVGTPEDVNLSRAALSAVYDRLSSEDEYFNAKSLLIVKDTLLVFEAYVRSSEDRDRYTHIASATKSITSLIFGIVMGDGYIDSLDQTLYSIMPDKFPPDPVKRTITLRHLLTMTSGILLDNEDFSIELLVDEPADPPKYFLSKPLYANPGTQYYYRDVDPHLISTAIQRLTGKTEEQWARERLLGPLGIWNYYWNYDHTGVTTGAFGLRITPRDMAKIGQMVLDNGRWKGMQVVDSAWIAQSTQFQVMTDHPSPPVYQYGFYWWVAPASQAFTAVGQGGNFIYVVPGRRMVIVMSSMADAGQAAGTSLDEFESLIGPLMN